jgi:hypothetical protein
LLVSTLQALFDVIAEQAEKGPLIVYIQVGGWVGGRVCMGGWVCMGGCAWVDGWVIASAGVVGETCFGAALGSHIAHSALSSITNPPWKNPCLCSPPVPPWLLQNLDRLLRSHATDHFRKLEALLAALPPRCLFFAGYCSRSLARAEAKKGGSSGGPPGLSRLFGSLGGFDSGGGDSMGGLGGGGGGGADDSSSLYDRLLMRGGARPRSKSTKGKQLSKMLPNHVELHPPNQDIHVSAGGWGSGGCGCLHGQLPACSRLANLCCCLRDHLVIRKPCFVDLTVMAWDVTRPCVQAKAWKRMVEGDVATMRQRSNRTALSKALSRCGLACDDLDAVDISDSQLGKKEVEQIVGVAVAAQLNAGKTGTAAAAAAAAAAETPDVAAAATGADAGQAASGQAAAAAKQQPAAVEAATAAAEPQEQQPSAMQTDDAAAPAAAGGAPPAAEAGTGKAPAGEQQEQGKEQQHGQGQGKEQQQQAGQQQQQQQPPWTLQAEHIVAAADSLRKLQQEAASAQPEKQALQEMAVDQYEKQLLSEVGGRLGGEV